jgi:hypothetical protein
MTHAIIVSDGDRSPIVAERRTDNGVVLRSGRSVIALNAAELDRVVRFSRREAVLQRFPCPDHPGNGVTRI